MTMNQQRLNINDYYSTSDLALATAISLYYPLEVVDRTNPHKALFLFKRDDQLDKFIEDYWKDKITIEPKTYFNQLRIIKSRLYEDR